MYLFLERRDGREKEGEKHQCVVVFHMPLLETWPATQARALTGNQTSDPLVHRQELNPLSHTSQGKKQTIFDGQTRVSSSAKIP